MPPNSFFIDRRIPLALLFTVFLQLGAVVWWASLTQAQDNFRDARLHNLEAHRASDTDKQDRILDRLTRLEVRSDAQMEVLQRLDTYIRKK